MVLTALVALTLAGGLLLRGSWDLWAQALLQLAAIGGLTLWLLSRIAVGHLPLPSRRNLLWAGALLALSALSVWASPLRTTVVPAWHVFLNALWIFPLTAALSKDERFYIDEALRAAAWVLMALAFYQKLRLGEAHPSSALVNPNIFAGTVLMLLPLAVEKRDWLLASGLTLSLWWTGSLGAWLGLFAAVVLTAPWRGGLRLWAGLAGTLICLVLVYDKFQSPEVLDRWVWWEAAARMVADRPWTGFGPEAFARILPAYKPAEGLATTYAHQYYLETAVSFGLPFAALWFGGLWHCLWSGRSHKRFGALAVLIHSLWDWPLSMPANLWLLTYFCASSLSEGWTGINIPSRRRLLAAALTAALGIAAGLHVWRFFAADRAKALAAAAFQEGRAVEAAQEAGEALRRVPGDPETHLLLARISLAGSAPDFNRAQEHLERAARLNPYRPATWTELAAVRRALGDEAGAAQALRDGTARLPRLARQGAR